MKIRQFNWEKRNTNVEERRNPTDEECEMLIKMFEECSWCTIRDILIDSGLTTEDKFPIFWFDISRRILRASKASWQK